MPTASELDAGGYCVVPDVLDELELNRMRGALDRLAAEDGAADVSAQLLAQAL